MSSLAFAVYGVAAPKGSAKGFYIKALKRAVITHDSKRTKPWQESVVAAARDALAGAPPLVGPVEVVVCFYMPRPKSAPKRVTMPATRPDVDKLLRCVLDGLTRAGVYGDDGQVVAVVTRKEFAGSARDPERERGVARATIVVQPLEESDTDAQQATLFVTPNATVARG